MAAVVAVVTAVAVAVAVATAVAVTMAVMMVEGVVVRAAVEGSVADVLWSSSSGSCGGSATTGSVVRLAQVVFYCSYIYRWVGRLGR